MTSVLQIDRLARCADPGGALLSLYVTVPAEPAGLRQLWVRVDGLLSAVHPAAASAPAVRRTVAHEVARVRDTLTENARDWLGHGVAVVSSATLGLHEALPVRSPVPDRVVLGVRPHLRPLLAALGRARPYVLAVVDRRNAWLYRMDGSRLTPTGRLVGQGVRDRSHAGWAGLEEYNVRHRAAELARRHYRSTVAQLTSLLTSTEEELVVGGHEVGITEFLEVLTPWLRDRVAGTFTVDPHTMTADELEDRSEGARTARRLAYERQLRADLADLEAGGLAVSGLADCAGVVSRSLSDLLVVAGSEVEPGYVCDDCGELAVDRPTCSCGREARAVPDLIDEMVNRMIRHRGQVEFLDVSQAQGAPMVAARLRSRVSRRVS
jgi:Bacterial archaeo-eukaryotic release factor family 10